MMKSFGPLALRVSAPGEQLTGFKSVIYERWQNSEREERERGKALQNFHPSPEPGPLRAH